MPDACDSLDDYVVDLYKGIYDVSEREDKQYMRRILTPSHSLCSLQEWVENFFSVDIQDTVLVVAMVNSVDLQKVKACLQKWQGIKLTR